MAIEWNPSRGATLGVEWEVQLIDSDTKMLRQEAGKLLDELLPILNAVNVTYNQAGGYKETITDGDLKQIDAYSGLTKAQLDDGMYVLTATIKGALTTGYDQLCELAVRGG